MESEFAGTGFLAVLGLTVMWYKGGQSSGKVMIERMVIYWWTNVESSFRMQLEMKICHY